MRKHVALFTASMTVAGMSIVGCADNASIPEPEVYSTTPPQTMNDPVEVTRQSNAAAQQAAERDRPFTVPPDAFDPARRSGASGAGTSSGKGGSIGADPSSGVGTSAGNTGTSGNTGAAGGGASTGNQNVNTGSSGSADEGSSGGNASGGSGSK